MPKELVKQWMKKDPYLLDPDGLQAFLNQQLPKQVAEETKLGTLSPLALLDNLFHEVHRHTHEANVRCWDTLVELIAATDFDGVARFPLPHIQATTHHTELLDKCHYRIHRYIEKAREHPDDHLGDLWNKYDMRGSDGQLLTPMNLCDLMIQMLIGGSSLTGEKGADKVETVMEPAFGTGRFFISLNRLYPFPQRRFVLFAVEIDVNWYRAGCLNMKLFSTHPYTVICGDALRLPHTTNMMHPIWDLGNRWTPPDMTPFYEWVEKHPSNLNSHTNTYDNEVK